jgi:hypothetical protein
VNPCCGHVVGTDRTRRRPYTAWCSSALHSTCERGVGTPSTSTHSAIFVHRTLAELNGDQLVSGVGRTQFKGEIVEESPFVYCDNDLSIVLLRQQAHQGSELCDVNLVHRFDQDDVDDWVATRRVEPQR